MPTPRGSAAMRTIVKIVFILCYVAFMYASIHRVATFFNNFEQSNDMFGSYLLAGAFDITALVTTIAVMFFRKSMPKPVFIGVWLFILGITGYSTFINWEYASHFQSMQLTMQATGVMTPVYDHNNVLHYVPQMTNNSTLVWLNPIMASAFTGFSLIYSIVAEFFGAKPPTAAELQKQIEYLRNTNMLNKQLDELQGAKKGPGWIERAKNAVLQTTDAVKEIAETVKPKEEESLEGEDKTDLTLAFFKNNPLATDQMLADYLQVDIISARQWRRKANEIEAEQPKEEPVEEPKTEELNVRSFEVEREKRETQKGKRGRPRNTTKNSEMTVNS